MSSLEKFERFVSQFAYKPNPDQQSGERNDIEYKRLSRRVSQGERLVQEILERDCGMRYRHDFVAEFVIEEGGKRLRFDYYLSKERLMIEFDGDQHYSGSRFHRTRDEWTAAIQRDEVKNEYCRKEKISLLRIPQVYARHPLKLKTLLIDFLRRVKETPDPIIEVDLYFKLKSGKITL
jgi:very-short-patch-repair endonuclease